MIDQTKRASEPQTVTLQGRRYVILPEAEYRRAVGLTQVELAKRAGVRPETLNRIEQAHRAPSPLTVEKIERALSEAEARDRAELEAEAQGRRRKR